MSPELLETLRVAQRFGFFGDLAIEQAAAHSAHFVTALSGDEARIVDLGSGGGLPGLVIAEACRDATILLIDRREKRTDFLHRAVRRLAFDHVEVRCDDVADLARSVESGRVAAFDAVTARGFGPPSTTLRLAARLTTDTGRIVISEPPSGDRWEADLLAELDLSIERRDMVSVFQRRR